MSGRVTVIGEVLVDLLWRSGADHVVPVPGGSPANVAVGLSRLGRPVTLVTVWGDDPPGELIRAHLERSGLDVLRAKGSSGRSTLAMAYLDAEGSASYDFLAAWDPEELPVPEDTTVLHTGSFGPVVEPGAGRVLELCRGFYGTPGRTVAVDLNVRPAVLPDRATYRAACLRLAACTDVVKASDEDLAWLFPDLDAPAAARLLLDAGPHLVLVTLGGTGALALTSSAEARVAAPTITVADTVGAGDAFQAALLDTLAERGTLPVSPSDLHQLLTRCVTAATITCTRVGANPPTSEELAAGTGE